jgi:hypothetical protein
MFLIAPGNDAAAISGVTLGGATISNKEEWNGKWTGLEKSRNGELKVDVAESSAVIVRMILK